MKRGYTVELYRRRVEVLREEVGDLELGSDWIVGFPGESETDFARTIELLEEQRFVQNYVFQYSPRPGTRAFDLEDDVPQEVKGERNRRLLAVAERVALSSLATRIGSTLEVFAEDRSRKDGGLLRGRSSHNLPVSFAGGAENVGRTVRVRIEDASPFGLWGALEPGPTIGPGPS